MIRTFKYRIHPTKRQVQTLNEHLAICCEVYNAALQERRDARQLEGRSISWFDQVLQLKEIRRIREDVAAVQYKALEESLRRVDLAFQGFFNRLRSGMSPGYPRFRSVQRYDSLTYRQTGSVLTGNRLRLSKIGMMRIKLHRPLIGTVKRLTIKREAGRWFALFVVAVETPPLPFNPNMVGVDVGLTSFATFSDGTKIENPRWLRSAEAKLRRSQRRVSRRRKGSNRRRDAVLLLQRLHARIRGQRRDFHHKASRHLVNAHGLIAVEDLNVKGLARSRLAKSVHDAGWSTFINMLTYKAEEAGRLLVKVDPRGTSQTCLCGAMVRKTLAVREHRCDLCGLVADRDHVSAQIILARSLPSGVNVEDLISCVA